MNKKGGFYLVCFIAGLLMALILNTQNTEELTQGSNLPLLSYEGNMGEVKIEKDSTKSTVIIWFHPDCEHCLYQLHIIDQDLSVFNQTRFFFFTDDKKFPSDRHLGKWTNLTSTTNVRFGIIDQGLFSDHFGPVVKPSLFIFNREGKLTNKVFGEVKTEKLIELINIKIVPEQDRAVLNNASDRG